MIVDCGREELLSILNKRLKMWGFSCGGGIKDDAVFEESLSRSEKCFSFSRNKRFTIDGKVKYSINHSVQTAILYYYISNTAYKYGNTLIADSVYYLNKIMHSVDWFYEIELPIVFGAEHPVGSVLGRAEYGNKLFVHQNTTVGSSVNKLPRIGENVVLCANSAVLGNCNVGNNVIISAGTIVINLDVPDNTIVFMDGSFHTLCEEKIKEKISILTDFSE